MAGSSAEYGGTNSDLSGNAGDVVQARDISGGIHFHGPGRDAVPVPAQLPGDVRGFVNRTADLQRLDAVLGHGLEHHGSASVCVIAGTAGVGKTALAVRWAHSNRERFPDGQLYVNLRGYDPGEPVTAAQALERFLTALGIPAAAVPADVEDRSALFRTLLANRRVLIVLDNAATVGHVRPLLPGVGRCLVVVTSRSRLSGLITRDGAHRVTLEVFNEPEAIELLKITVADYRSGDDDAEISELARLCARLPLALRIAAERAASRPRMPMGELIFNLRDESHLWDALSAEDDDEADAVRTVFAWSYRALSPEAARIFRLLGLHPGPDFSVHAAAALTGVPVHDARSLLDSLVGVHLLGQTGSDRFEFHDLLRAYATDQTRHQETEDSQAKAIRDVLDWYLHTAAACALRLDLADPMVRPVPLESPDATVRPLEFLNSSDALEWFDTERKNIAEAVAVAIRCGQDDLGWKIPAVLRTVYGSLNLYDDWLATAKVGLEAARRLSDVDGEAFLLESLLMASRQSFQLDDAAMYGELLLQIYRDTDDSYGEAATCVFLGLACLEGHQLEQARDYINRTESISRLNGYPALLTSALSDLAWLSTEATRYEEALAYGIEALDLARDTGSLGNELYALMELACALRGLGDLEQAAERAQQALSIARDIRSDNAEAYILGYYGDIQRARRDMESALDSYHRAANIHRRVGNRNQEARSLDRTGAAYRELGRSDEAAAFHRQAIAIFREIGNKWHQAIALDHLAHSLHAADGAQDQAAQSWRAAMRLLEGFDDPAALELRGSIARALGATQ